MPFRVMRNGFVISMFRPTWLGRFAQVAFLLPRSGPSDGLAVSCPFHGFRRVERKFFSSAKHPFDPNIAVQLRPIYRERKLLEILTLRCAGVKQSRIKRQWNAYAAAIYQREG